MMAKVGAQHRLIEAVMHHDPKFAKPSGLLKPPQGLVGHANFLSNKAPSTNILPSIKPLK